MNRKELSRRFALELPGSESGDSILYGMPFPWYAS